MIYSTLLVFHVYHPHMILDEQVVHDDGETCIIAHADIREITWEFLGAESCKQVSLSAEETSCISYSTHDRPVHLWYRYAMWKVSIGQYHIIYYDVVSSGTW